MATRKQAVLVIHGIGHQSPMQTLRSFVKTVWSEHDAIHHEHAGHDVWSKPDEVSKSFELRRLSTPRNAGGIETDFFEFYWAHLMHGTGYGHVLGWAWSLLWRAPRSVPDGLRAAYCALWLLVLVLVAAWIGYLGVTAGRGGPAGPDAGGAPLLAALVPSLVIVVVIPAVGFVMKEIVGDAARYLRPSPRNIQRRHEIRAAGVELLRALHGRGYDRIVVVGHSLGSVIGYDILTYAFPEYNVPTDARGSAAGALEKLETIAQDASVGEVAPVAEIQRAQRGYCEELAAIGGKWRVTDFVTLGSPLAHSEVLLAADARELGEKVRSREYPRCLPVLEQKLRTDDAANRHFAYGPKPERTNGRPVRIPHHAAVFAPTRWTNLYFPARLILYGDLIGGAIGRALGEGVRNVPVATHRRRGFLTHRFYWAATRWRAGGDDRRRNAVEALREALDLTDRGAAPEPGE